jgi:RimJ/RimL family protein N-acetyltransferase
MEIRQLNKNDALALKSFIKEFESTVEDEYWYKTTDKLQSQYLEGELCKFYGAFDDNKLIGICGLILNEKLSATSISTLGENIAEIQKGMVLKEYRGSDIMLQICKELVKLAKDLNKKEIVAVVPTDSLSSKKTLETLGFHREYSIGKWSSIKSDYYKLLLK